MTLRSTIEVITQLAARGVIANYAIAGAIAALNYIEPMLTQDLDILVSVDGLKNARRAFCFWARSRKRLPGYSERTNVGFKVEGWPVQFLPVASPLDEEALQEAIEIDVARRGEEPLAVRCLRAEHVVATALTVGRLKDLARIQAFLEQDAVDLKRLKIVLKRHKLVQAWDEFCLKATIKNPLLEIQ